MLYDCPYMRDSDSDGKTTPIGWLIAAIVAGFLLQTVTTRLFKAGTAVQDVFGLTPLALREGHGWTLLSYGFLHDQTNLLHILCNILALYFLGRPLLPLLGSQRFLGLFGAATILGGACWCAVNWHHGGILLGASSGIFALLIVFACFYPNQEITFLLFFILPITLKPKYLALACVALDLFGCVSTRSWARRLPWGLAHSAHLGGMAAGWLYFRFVHNVEWRMPGRRARSRCRVG